MEPAGTGGNLRVRDRQLALEDLRTLETIETKMQMTAIPATTRRAAGGVMSFGDRAPTRSPGSDSLRQFVAAALAEESSLSLAESIRTYASESRANGESIHEVLEVLMNLARDTTPKNASPAKRSCEIAEWAISGYFEQPQSMYGAIRSARVRSKGSGVRRS